MEGDGGEEEMSVLGRAGGESPIPPTDGEPITQNGHPLFRYAPLSLFLLYLSTFPHFILLRCVLACFQ